MGTFKAIKLERYLKIFLNNRGDYKLCDLTRRDTALAVMAIETRHYCQRGTSTVIFPYDVTMVR